MGSHVWDQVNLPTGCPSLLIMTQDSAWPIGSQETDVSVVNQWNLVFQGKLSQIDKMATMEKGNSQSEKENKDPAGSKLSGKEKAMSPDRESTGTNDTSKSKSSSKGKSSKRVPAAKSSAKPTQESDKLKSNSSVQTRSHSVNATNKTSSKDKGVASQSLGVSGQNKNAQDKITEIQNPLANVVNQVPVQTGNQPVLNAAQATPTQIRPPLSYQPNTFHIASPAQTQGQYNPIPDYLQQGGAQYTPRAGFDSNQYYSPSPMMMNPMNAMFMNPFLFHGFQQGWNQTPPATQSIPTATQVVPTSANVTQANQDKPTESTPKPGSSGVKSKTLGKRNRDHPSKTHELSSSDEDSDDDLSDCNLKDVLSDSEDENGSVNEIQDMDDDDDHEDDFLLDNLAEGDEDEVCGNAHEKTAKIVNGQWTRGIKNPAKLEIQKVYSESKRPANITSLVRPKINEEIRAAAGTIPFNRDNTPRAICTAMVKGAINVADVLDSLLASKVRFPKRRRILESCERAIKCLSYGNAKLGYLRRQLFKPFLAHPYKKLCDYVEKPSHQWLYGDDFGDASTNVEKTQKMSNKMSAKKAAAQKIKKAHKFQQMKQRRDLDGYGQGQARNVFQGGRQHQSGYGPQSGYQGNNWWVPWMVSQACIDNANYSFLPIQQFRQQYVQVNQAHRYNSHNGGHVNQYVNQHDSHSSYNVVVDHNVNNSVVGSNVVNRHNVLCRSTPAPAPTRQLQEIQGQEQEVECNQRAKPVDAQVKENYVHNFPVKFRDFVAGGLGQNIHVWRTLTSDPSILKLLEGVELDFKETPVQHRLPHEIQFSDHEKILVQAELQKFLDWGIIEETTILPGDFVSNLFTRPKKEPNRIRLILNLKQLNRHVRFIHFKMDGVDAVLHLIRPRVYMYSIDLSQSFYSIPVHPRYYRYLKCICLGKCYRFKCLPMGYSQSPLLFCKLLKVPLSYLREQFGHTTCNFVDDIFGVEDTFQEARTSSIDSVDVIQSCGYTVNVDKSDVYPEMAKNHLGLIFDSLEMSVRLTPDKCEKLIDLAYSILGKSKVRIRSLASLVGQMNAARYVMRYGPLHTKALEIAKNRALVHSQGDFDGFVSLSLLDEMDIQWWIRHLPDAHMPILDPPISEIISTDASKDGFGYYDYSSRVSGGGRWSEEERQLHINCLELRSILLSLKALFPGQRQKHLKIFCDSQVAIACILRQGSTRSLACNTHTRNLLLYCEEFELILTLAFIGTAENVEADFESRHFSNPDTEWSLHQSVFDQICNILQMEPDIDLFAERLNAKLPCYCAWKPDPQASYIDAFSVQWSDFACIYLFVPFSLVGRVLHHFLHLPRTTHAILIAPMWKTSPWYTLALNYLIRQPIVLRVKPNFLTLEHDKSKVHPLANKLKLLALGLSNSSTEAKAFRERFPKLWLVHEQTQRTNNTRCITGNGFTFVSKDRLIPSILHSISV